MKKDRAITVGVTKNFWPALVAVYSATRHINLPHEVVVYYHDMPREYFTQFSSLGATRFIEFTTYPYDPELSCGYTHMTYFRYEIFALLQDYRQVLALDIDTLTIRPLDGMLESHNSGFCAVHDYDYRVDWEDRGWPEDIIPHRPIPANLNAGVLVINDDIPWFEEITGWCHAAHAKYRPGFNKQHVGDQGIINLVPHAFCGGWNEMDYAYNATWEKMRTVPDPAILHFAGGPKPWAPENRQEKSKKIYGESAFAEWHRWSAQLRNDPDLAAVIGQSPGFSI